MKIVLAYLRIYADCLRRTFLSLRKNPWTPLLPPLLSVGFDALAGVLASALGPTIARFVVSLLIAAAVSCYLYFLGGVVAQARVKVNELGQAVRTYFWSVMNVLFVLWIATLVSDLVLASLPQGAALKQVLFLGVVILCNATPEVIYLKGTYGGLATLQRSFHFLQENWIEWGIPNLLLLAGLYELRTAWLQDVPWFISSLLFGALLHVGMVFRGHLFEVLDGSSHRQRMFKYRTAG